MNKQQILDNYLESIQLSESLMLQENINFNSLTNNYKKLITTMKGELVKHKVSVSAIENDAKKLAKRTVKKIRKNYEQGTDPKTTAKLFESEIQSLIKSKMQPVLKKVETSAKANIDLESWKKVVIGVGATILVFFINTFMFNVLILITQNIMLAYVMCAVIIGPIVEETAKSYFIAMNMPWSGTAIFAGLELLRYVQQLLAVGMALPTILLIRAMVIALHFATTAIQKYIQNSAPPGTDYRKIAWLAGVFVHMTWNSMAIIQAT